MVDLLSNPRQLKKIKKFLKKCLQPKSKSVESIYQVIFYVLKKEIVMDSNVGKNDRIARIASGLLLVLLAVTGVISAWGWLGLILIATGLISFCPLYALFNKSTCNRKKLLK